MVDPSSTQPFRLNFELTTACDHRCSHCYNVWGGEAAAGAYDRRLLDTKTTAGFMERAIRESGATFAVITGGEPLLRPDALDLVEVTRRHCPLVLLVTNGSHLNREAVSRLHSLGVAGVQLTFLSADPDRHDRLKGRVSFVDTVEATRALRARGLHVQVCFVATLENAGELEGVMELCRELGVDDLVYNRMSPSGGAVDLVARLVPTIEQVEHNLEAADRLGRAHRIRVSTAMPIPPCLIRIDRYRWIRFGFCSTHTATPNLVIDPVGNVRACNLSAEMLGNVLQQPWSEIMASPYLGRFVEQLPLMCQACPYVSSCCGGCKESGRAVFGRLDHPEPLLYFALNPAAREGGDR